MTKKIWFDMDGTIANLYGVNGWLEMLTAYDATPYATARPLFNMNALARVLNRLTREGWEICVVSWLSKNSNAEYDRAVTEAKMAWLNRHLHSVKFAQIDIIAYGTPKHENRNGILFDDEEKNRKNWGEGAYDVQNILEILKSL